MKLQDKIKTAEDRIKELSLLIEHWKRHWKTMELSEDDLELRRQVLKILLHYYPKDTLRTSMIVLMSGALSIRYPLVSKNIMMSTTGENDFLFSKKVEKKFGAFFRCRVGFS